MKQFAVEEMQLLYWGLIFMCGQVEAGEKKASLKKTLLRSYVEVSICCRESVLVCQRVLIGVFSVQEWCASGQLIRLTGFL